MNEMDINNLLRGLGRALNVSVLPEPIENITLFEILDDFGGSRTPPDGRCVALVTQARPDGYGNGTKQRMFALIAKTNDEVITTLRATLSDQTKALTEATGLVVGLQDELRMAAKREEAMKKSLDGALTENQKLIEERSAWVKRNSHLEGDLAKVQKFFGEKAYADALKAT
jgi:hypothetical protein